MSNLGLLSISFVLFLVALPLTSFGTTENQSLIWWLGLVALLIAGVLPPLTRLNTEEEGES